MFRNPFKLQALASAAATTVVALTLAASPRAADAAQVQFALHDLAAFTSFSLVDPELTFSGTGFVGMIDDRWGSVRLDVVTAPVPEPATWGLMFAGLAAVGGLARRRNGGRR